jgi:ubiquinone biosynthesis protein
MNATLRSLGVIFFLGLCACGFIVGAFLSFAQKQWTVAGYPMIGVLAIACAATLFGVAFGWYLFAGKFRKISLARMLRARKRR